MCPRGFAGGTVEHARTSRCVCTTHTHTSESRQVVPRVCALTVTAKNEREKSGTVAHTHAHVRHGTTEIPLPTTGAPGWPRRCSVFRGCLFRFPRGGMLATFATRWSSPVCHVGEKNNHPSCPSLLPVGTVSATFHCCFVPRACVCARMPVCGVFSIHRSRTLSCHTEHPPPVW